MATKTQRTEWTYRGVTITRTGIDHGDTGRKLLELDGAVTKPAGQRPLISTLTDAKAHVDMHLVGPVTYSDA